jgi:predicted ATP-dependent endonuclease of OLD family
MKLLSVKLKNFRGYRNETYIQLNNLTAFVGQNDAGKSSILEALEIFFNNSIVKIDKDDLNVDAKAAGENKIEITCTFTDLPFELIIDADNPTTLQAEYLINRNGELEIKKIYTCGAATPKEQIFIIANHPTCENGNDLLLLKRTELRARANQLGIPAGNYNANLNSSLRSTIWNFLADLSLNVVSIQIDKEDTKKAWEYIEKWMPQYALFKSDRASNDNDKEITDPMKVAINSAIAEVETQLAEVQETVMNKAIDVANRTLAKLQEMNPDLANELRPDFKADPKWAGLFTLTLNCDRDIPINKRGSGVRRLIVLNFFRAEAERRRDDMNSKAIIYAFEEPENSQHPNHQEMLIRAFIELADTNNTQVILTTHNPALAGLVQESDLRFVTFNSDRNIIILSQSQDILRQIANTLGMLPEPLKPRLLFCVEGPNDVIFFKNISRTIHQNRHDLPDLNNESKVAIFPLGGGTLKDWVNHDYLSGLDLPQYHIYDLDDQANPPYLAQRDAVRIRGGQHWADLTSKRETENYLCPTCIQNVFGFEVIFGDMDDLPEIVASTQHNANSSNPWNSLSQEDKKKKTSRVKRRLNSEVAQQMTWDQIQAADPNGNIISWLETIRDRIN